jgi:hypothetical protein
MELFMSRRRPATRLWIFLTCVFALGFGAAGYLNYVQYQRARDDHAQLTGTITDLQYQVAQDHKSTPTPSASPSPSGSPSPSPSPTVLAAQSLALTELGLHLSTSAPLTDLTYQYQQISGLAVANLTTAALIKSTTTCGPGALGSLVRRPITYKPTSLSKLVKTVGSYTYYYVAPVKACAKDPVTTAALLADKTALPAILATLAP